MRVARAVLDAAPRHSVSLANACAGSFVPPQRAPPSLPPRRVGLVHRLIVRGVPTPGALDARANDYGTSSSMRGKRDTTRAPDTSSPSLGLDTECLLCRV
jgi:hypothetical protein